jgi:excisionase family DNA binding protein
MRLQVGNKTERMNEIAPLWKEGHVARLLNCSRRNVGNLRARGVLRFFRVGGLVRFNPKHVQEDLKRLEVQKNSK